MSRTVVTFVPKTLMDRIFCNELLELLFPSDPPSIVFKQNTSATGPAELALPHDLHVPPQDQKPKSPEKPYERMKTEH